MEDGGMITIEGGDGAGKSINIEVIVEYLENQGYEVIQTREPGGRAFKEPERVVLIDSQKPLAEVYDQVVATLDSFFQKL